MKITAMTDTSDLRNRMGLWASLVKKETSEGLRQFARVACVNLATSTQPFGDSKSDKEPGERAVEVDISKVFYTPEPYGGFVNKMSEMAYKVYSAKGYGSRMGVGANEKTLAFTDRLNGYAASGNTKALKRMASNFNWQGIIDTIDPALHQQARSGARMRVSKKDNVGKMHLLIGGRKTALQSYIKTVQKKVGLTKAAWAVCADKIPVKRSSSSTRGIPQWVTRNMYRASGSIIDQSDDPSNPRISMSNMTPWASQCISPTQVTAALDIARNKFVAYMNIQIKKELRSQAKLKAAA